MCIVYLSVEHCIYYVEYGWLVVLLLYDLLESLQIVFPVEIEFLEEVG